MTLLVIKCSDLQVHTSKQEVPLRKFTQLYFPFYPPDEVYHRFITVAQSANLLILSIFCRIHNPKLISCLEIHIRESHDSSTTWARKITETVKISLSFLKFRARGQ